MENRYKKKTVLFGAQIFCIYKFKRVVIVNKNKNLIFALF